MLITANDRLHELHINDAQRNMENAFLNGDINLAHEHCNEFGRLIQSRSQAMIDFMEKEKGIFNYVSCVENRKTGAR